MSYLVDFLGSGEPVESLAPQLLGMELHTQLGDMHTAVRITEVEAYRGHHDRASHSSQGRRTPRNEVMYGPAGHAYVYLIYGIYHLVNVVTNVTDQADAVLLRAGEPLVGVDHMLQRRGLQQVERRLTAGPGLLSQALGITTELSGASLLGPEIALKGSPGQIPRDQIRASPRVGVAYAGTDALLPWRFGWQRSAWLSPAEPKY